MAKILIVDDRQVNREFLMTLLSYQNHHLLEAGLATEALAIIYAERPDLVITDILMPEIDGFEFVRRIRAIPAIAATRVIFYSANYVESEARMLAAACGVEYVIAKPAEPEQILSVVQSALGIEAPPAHTMPSAEFDRAHQRLLIDKLAEKVNELETLNASLEQRVQERTTELAAANERLRELNAFKDNLLMIASHDLRSPLGIIQNIAGLILDNPATPETTRRAVQTIMSSAEQLNSLVADILDISSLEAGKVVLEPIIIQVGFIVEQVIENLRYSAEAKQIHLSLEVSPTNLVVLADWHKLSQVFSNLIGNAIKFTPPGGWIAVTIKPEGEHICCEVADNGLGIPGEAIPHIFEKFQRAHPTGTNNERGSGLGLAIVQQLVELHGGKIEVHSQVGQGSRFRVYLPAIQ
ncbi:integral membrane sensor signal transduction histidine kinase [Oscillochloris trichoides DG-6]|uniref:histidine kinase n=1 Tax=Oscillochloris trichoides DG-6 TaxID=765420 RepID=E1ICY2_9CHLR|nr:hybrid sensor histidine kinase/response regulator [Oscillochloris trichoides]EFO80952.1 integral membrane sensor signal transduction histidine kinase [Oscillochloris trichoides DG-6]